MIVKNNKKKQVTGETQIIINKIIMHNKDNKMTLITRASNTNSTGTTSSNTTIEEVIKDAEAEVAIKEVMANTKEAEAVETLVISINKNVSLVNYSKIQMKALRNNTRKLLILSSIS